MGIVIAFFFGFAAGWWASDNPTVIKFYYEAEEKFKRWYK